MAQVNRTRDYLKLLAFMIGAAVFFIVTLFISFFIVIVALNNSNIPGEEKPNMFMLGLVPPSIGTVYTADWPLAAPLESLQLAFLEASVAQRTGEAEDDEHGAEHEQPTGERVGERPAREPHHDIRCRKPQVLADAVAEDPESGIPGLAGPANRIAVCLATVRMSSPGMRARSHASIAGSLKWKKWPE